MTTQKMTQKQMTAAYNDAAITLNLPTVSRLRNSKLETVEDKYLAIVAKLADSLTNKNKNSLLEKSREIKDKYKMAKVKLNKNHIKVNIAKNTFYIYSSKEGFKLLLANNNIARLSNVFFSEISTNRKSNIWDDSFFNVSSNNVNKACSILANLATE